MKKLLSIVASGLIFCSAAQAQELEEAPPAHAEEFQLEYLEGNKFNQRNVNNYNVHYFAKVNGNDARSYWRGLTFTRALGYTNPRRDGGVHHDSQGVGLGAAYMFRWQKPLSGKLHGSLDFTGSLMLYNKAHPYDGRAYGFLWRLGPRLTWQFREDESVSVGYSISHFSNGLRSHNPGYNTLGVSVGYSHKW